MDYQDKTLVCVECGGDFVFSAGEQLFYATKNFKNEPQAVQGLQVKEEPSLERSTNQG